MHPDKLDELLSMGWFRMGQSIFTTNYILVESSMYRTIWLRHVIKQYQETKTLRNLKKRNRDFRVELKPLEITIKHEELFEKYKNGFNYFYPGYFIPGHSHLDYKLDIGTHCLEFFNPEDTLWYPISDYVDEGIPIEYQDFFED